MLIRTKVYVCLPPGYFPSMLYIEIFFFVLDALPFPLVIFSCLTNSGLLGLLGAVFASARRAGTNTTLKEMLVLSINRKKLSISKVRSRKKITY